MSFYNKITPKNKNVFTPIPHGINVTSQTTWTQIYATATSSTTLQGWPIPFVDQTGGANGITIWVDATNVYIAIANPGYAVIDRIVIVLKYLQS